MYDLNEMILLIYDFLYNMKANECLTNTKIILGEIGLDDIKITISSKDDIYYEQYDMIKKEVLDGRFKLLSYDNDINQIIFKKYSNQFSVDVKITFYQSNEKQYIQSFDSIINNDSLFSYILSSLVLEEKTKHILLPIINIDMELDDINHLIKDDSCYKMIKDNMNNSVITNKCCLQLREHFFRTEKLDEYLKKNNCCYKHLLFQVIHTIAVIQNEYSGFRHNNLEMKNIMLYLKKDSNSYVEYNGFKNDKFYLQDCNFDIKITNFEYAVIPKYYGLKNLKNPKIKFADMSNPYYDLYTFLNDLIKGMTFKTNCDAETKKFLDIIIPPHIRGDDYKQFNKNYVIISPIDALYDKYFDEFRKLPEIKLSKKEEIYSNHLYLTGIKTHMDSDNYSILGEQDKIISKLNIMKKNNSRNINVDNISHSNLKRVERTNKMNKRIIKQDGGDKIEMDPIKATKNDPFYTNEMKEINKKNAGDAPAKNPNILLEQTIYNPPPKPSDNKQYVPPAFIPLYNTDGSMINNMLPYNNVPNTNQSVQKVYNVSLSNPIGNYTSLNKIYEDVLPGSPNTYSALTLFERKQLIDFLRNNILDSIDGEEMTVTGGKNSLLSFIKIMDANPYSLNKNPYVDLAKNFLLYKAAYPVRFDEKTKNIGIAKTSMGINIRMYMMSMGDLRCKTINNMINCNNFDLWRELKYYDWVREELVKRRISPNFIAPFLYKIDSESKIDWSKLELIKTKGYTNDTLMQLKENERKINDNHKLNKDMGLFQFLLPRQFRDTNVVKKEEHKNHNGKEETGTLAYCKRIVNNADNPDKLTDEMKEDLTKNSGKVLVLLTEAPTTGIIQWASTVYNSMGSVKKMISTGYHSPEIWKSIIFQMVYVFAVLQERNIYMKNVTLENNIYIKDLTFDPNSVGSWIYKIDSIEYYVPNYGYILMFDSKYVDIETQQSLIRKPLTEKQYKIYGPLYNDTNNYSDDIYAQFKNVVNHENFAHNFKSKGGSIPDDNIIALLRAITNYTDNNKIRDIIPKFFREYIHNRVGTLLTQTEKLNINVYSRANFVKGNLMVWQKRFQEYEWVLYNGETADRRKKEIIVKTNNTNYNIIEVFPSALFSYPENELILQESKNNMKYDDKYIFETYNLDDLPK